MVFLASCWFEPSQAIWTPGSTSSKHPRAKPPRWRDRCFAHKLWLLGFVNRSKVPKEWDVWWFLPRFFCFFNSYGGTFDNMRFIFFAMEIITKYWGFFFWGGGWGVRNNEWRMFFSKMDNWCISLCPGLSHLSVSYPQRFLVVSARGAFGLSYPEQIMCAAVIVSCYRGLARWIQPWGFVGARKFRIVWCFFHVPSLRITCSRLKVNGTGRWDSFSDGLLFRGELLHVSFIEGITITSWKHGVNSCQEIFQQKGVVSTRWGPTIVVNGVIYI